MSTLSLLMNYCKIIVLGLILQSNENIISKTIISPFSEHLMQNKYFHVFTLLV
jgi:hypothetical protein